VTRLHSLANRRSDFLIPNQRTGGREVSGTKTWDTSIIDKSSRKILSNRACGIGNEGHPSKDLNLRTLLLPPGLRLLQLRCAWKILREIVIKNYARKQDQQTKETIAPMVARLFGLAQLRMELQQRHRVLCCLFHKEPPYQGNNIFNIRARARQLFPLVPPPLRI
jgi:hypothetical protein